MRYIAAYLLSALSGNENPKETDIEAILGSVGIESDPERIKLVVEKMNGQNIEEVLTRGKEKLQTLLSLSCITPAPEAVEAPSSPSKAPEEVEETKEESEESDEDMGFGLFD